MVGKNCNIGESCRASILTALLLALGLAGLTSCESANRLLKARPAELSSFVEHPSQMEPRRDRVPFHRIWISRDRALQKRVATKSEIYIAPVTLRHLRPISKALARREVEEGSLARREKEMAEQLREDFIRAFAASPQAILVNVSQPSAYSLTLELAIVELNPTSPPGNAAKTAAGFMVGPIAGVAGFFTKGNMAIEGKVRNSTTHELVFEFAYNQADRMTLYSVRDLKPYGHAVHAMEEWAAQFEEFTRTPAAHKVEEAPFYALKPW